MSGIGYVKVIKVVNILCVDKDKQSSSAACDLSLTSVPNDPSNWRMVTVREIFVGIFITVIVQ